MSEMSAEAIPNQYVVVFKHHTPEDARQQHYKWAQSAHSEAAAALRVASGGPELSGVGEQFNIETMFGYFGCFDEDLKNEIESKEEVSPTSDHTFGGISDLLAGYRSTLSNRTTRFTHSVT